MSISTGPASTLAAAGGASMSTDRLGTGVAFPLVPDPVTGALDWSSGAPDVRQSIRLILQTDPGERVMRPTFGAGLRGYLMDPNTPSTRAQIALDVQAALQTWEPRITVTSVLVVPGDDPAEALVTVSYVHVRDQALGSISVTVPTAGNGGSP
jgi:phage baseplate assembly protein W